MKPASIYSKLTLVTILSAGAIFFSSCSSSTDPDSGTGTASFQSEMSQSSVNAMIKGGNGNDIASGTVCDSIKIKRVRILISNVKLHASEDADSTNDKTVKIGPMIMIIDSSGQRVVTSATVPAATYEKIKFEIHRFPSSIDQQYLNDSTYAVFVTDERTSVVIEGTLWSLGDRTPRSFTYKGKPTVNLSFKLDPPVKLEAGSNTTFTFQLNPVLIFKETGNKPLDPRDSQNAGKIDDMIKKAIKALKK